MTGYETSGDVANVARLLSHATLVASYVARAWPDEAASEP